MNLRTNLPASVVFLALFLGGGALAMGASALVLKQQANDQRQITAHELTGGDPSQGRTAFLSRGCGACHSVKNSQLASGQVGPALDKIAVRTFLAGRLSNDPAEMIGWIQ